MAIFFFSTEVQMNVCVCAQFGAIYLFLFDYSTLALSLPLEIANNAILLFLNEEKTSTTVRRLMLRILSIKRNTQARAHVCKFIWHCCGIGTEPNKSFEHSNSRYVHGCNRINKLCFCYVLYIYLVFYVLNKVEASVSKCAHIAFANHSFNF